MVKKLPVHPLRKWRESQGKTQEACAESIGTTRQVWSDYERRRRVPNRVFMPRIVALTAGKVTADAFYQQQCSDLQDVA